MKICPWNRRRTTEHNLPTKVQEEPEDSFRDHLRNDSEHKRGHWVTITQEQKKKKMWKPGTHVGTIKRRVSLLHTCVLMNAAGLAEGRGLGQYWEDFFEVFSTYALFFFTGLWTGDGWWRRQFYRGGGLCVDLIVSFDDHHFLSSVRARPVLFSVSWPETWT